jgi:nicotinamidase-related amidase
MKAADLPKSNRVLLLIDFINPLDFPGAEKLAPGALEAARSTAALKARLSAAGVPAIYANDNFGGWQSDFQRLVKSLAGGSGPSAEIAVSLAPGASDLTILKPRHSAFHASPLALLLTQMGAEEIVLTGLATDICVQITAVDAFLHGYRTLVPSDCTAAESATAKRQSLAYMRRVLKCDTAPSAFVCPAAT